MIWPSIFVISLVQGIFLVFQIQVKVFKNYVAKRLIIAILIIFILTSLGYMSVHTDLLYYVPQLFGIQVGLLFLLGPFLYLYTRSVLEPTFKWEKIYWLHFIPYTIQLLFYIKIFFVEKNIWIDFIKSFLNKDLYLRDFEIVLFSLELIHLFIYIIFTSKWIRDAKNKNSNIKYITPFQARMKWMISFVICFVILLTTRLCLVIFVIANGKFDPVTNYIYIIIMTGIIYFIAYNFSSKEFSISPDFEKKYKSYKSLPGEEETDYVKKLLSLFTEDKIFVNSTLKLKDVSKKLNIPQHQISRLINEKFNKSFTDFVNEFRIKEFILRMNNPVYQSFSLLGIAFEVGFNSKSAFNASFKKITGKTPSEFKEQSLSSSSN